MDSYTLVVQPAVQYEIATESTPSNGLTAGDLATALASYLTLAGAVLLYQPLDADLTAIAGLSTTSFGRGLLTEANAASIKTTLGLNNVENAAASTLYVGLTGTQTIAGAKTFSNSVATLGAISSTGTSVASSSSATWLSISPTYNQTGTAGSTDFKINRTETALGSGSHLFADFQLASSTRWNVSKFGTMTMSGNIVMPGTATTRTIQVGDTYNDGSELQILNGATTMGRFNAATGFITGLNIQASGTLRISSISYLDEVRVPGASGVVFQSVTPTAVGAANCPWRAYTANSNVLYFRDGVNSRMHSQFEVGSSDTAANSRFFSNVVVSGLTDSAGGRKTKIVTFAALPSASANTDCELCVSDRSNRPLVKSDGTNWINLFTGAIQT